MTSWRFIVFKDRPDGRVQSHAVHAWTRAALLADLKIKYPLDEVEEDKPCPELFLDVPGMVITTRPVETFLLLGLKLEIPCEDVHLFADGILETLTAPDQRHWRPGGYTKLAGFHRMLVLTRNQARALWKMMDAKLAECVKKAADHDDAWRRGVQMGAQ